MLRSAMWVLCLYTLQNGIILVFGFLTWGLTKSSLCRWGTSASVAWEVVVGPYVIVFWLIWKWCQNLLMDILLLGTWRFQNNGPWIHISTILIKCSMIKSWRKTLMICRQILNYNWKLDFTLYGSWTLIKHFPKCGEGHWKGWEPLLYQLSTSQQSLPMFL